MTNKIKVRVTGEQRIRYSQIIEISAKEWELIKDLSEHSAAEHLSEYLDPNNPIDWDPLDDFEAIVVDENDNPVKPKDYYGKE